MMTPGYYRSKSLSKYLHGLTDVVGLDVGRLVVVEKLRVFVVI